MPFVFYTRAKNVKDCICNTYSQFNSTSGSARWKFLPGNVWNWQVRIYKCSNNIFMYYITQSCVILLTIFFTNDYFHPICYDLGSTMYILKSQLRYSLELILINLTITKTCLCPYNECTDTFFDIVRILFCAFQYQWPCMIVYVNATRGRSTRYVPIFANAIKVSKFHFASGP